MNEEQKLDEPVLNPILKANLISKTFFWFQIFI